MVGVWNALPGVVVVDADTIVAFKMLLDRHIEMQEFEGYGSVKADEINVHHVASCSAQTLWTKGLVPVYVL